MSFSELFFSKKSKENRIKYTQTSPRISDHPQTLLILDVWSFLWNQMKSGFSYKMLSHNFLMDFSFGKKYNTVETKKILIKRVRN